MPAESVATHRSQGRLRDFGVAFGRQVVLRNVNLTLPERGVLLLLGSAGEGKSTLLRTVAGLNGAQPSLRTWGEMAFHAGRPALVHQNARLMLSTLHENLVSGLATRSTLTRVEQTAVLGRHLRELGLADLQERLADDVSSLPRAQQRLASIARALLADPACLLLDEPTAGLLDDEPGAQRIVDLIRAESSRRLVVVTTHNQRHAQDLGGEVVLLVDGTVHERTPTSEFFGPAASPAAQTFVRSGRCSLTPREPDPAVPAAVSRYLGPKGFYWLLQGRLGGAPRPGVTTDLALDLSALARLGTTHLVSLEERLYYDAADVEAHGMLSSELPIDDMAVPGMEAAQGLCRWVENTMATGGVVVLHCRAGLGRTGTMLAAQLIHGGVAAVEALEQARAINPRWVQSDAQVRFLSEFETWRSAGMRSAGAVSQKETTR